MAPKKADSTGLHFRHPSVPGHAKAGTPPRRSEAGGGTLPYMAPEKQRFTTPARVSKVQGLEAGTVLPPAQIQPIPGFQIL
jgi:hypothetical protein